MALTLDLLEGNRGRKTKNGWELERIAVVSGVTGDGSDKIVNAEAVGGMPSIGDAHPASSSAKLQEIICDSVDSETVKFRLIYSQRTYTGREWTPPLDTIEVGGSVIQEESNKDAGGVAMSVQYAVPSNYQYDDKWRNTTKTQGGFVSKLIPQHTIVISKTEYLNPAPKAALYVGKVNNGPWSLDMSAAARTWLCTGIIGRSQDGGFSYTVTYTFQYKPDTWDKTVIWIDPHDGKPAPDLVDGTGIKTYQIYTMANFNSIV